MAGPAQADIRYTAFLSYSHKDAAAAARLHRRLESYRVPKRLVGSETPRGPVPQRLWPIFRDREELPAATDLSETVRTALAQSGALVILCSPSAAGSLWVAEEIETFRKLHPDRPILAAILDGDPPECFPEALRAFGQDGTWHEPLATDLRAKADGKHLGLLKLVAGITGIGLDDLVQRDAARRVRRVMAVTVGAVTAMLIMGALAVIALKARAEAEHQRAEAKGLADFMLNDLRERLRGVGRLDIMAPVNRRALVFYEGQLRSYGLPADALMRARTLHAIGEDVLRRGDQTAALRIFQEARATTGQLAANTPNDPAVTLAHGQSEYWVGRISELRQDWQEARRRYLAFAGAADRALAAEPGNPDYVAQAAWSALDLGNIQLNGTGEFAAAQTSYEKAVQRFGRVLQMRPGNQEILRAQANAYGWLADSFFLRRMWPESLEARRAQYRIVREQYLADPTNFESQFRLAIAQRGLYRSLLHTGSLEEAQSLLNEAHSRAAQLIQRDPRNSEWQLFQAQVGCELLYGGLRLPAGVSIHQARNEVRAAATELDDSGRRVLRNCLTAMNSR